MLNSASVSHRCTYARDAAATLQSFSVRVSDRCPVRAPNPQVNYSGAVSTPILDLDNLPWPQDRPEHFVFDVDGTLTDHESVTHPPTLEALRAAHDAGYPITVATGRILSAGVRLLERAGVDGWVIANCGGVVWDGNDVVDEHPLPRETVENFISLGRSLGMTPAVYFVDDIYMDTVEDLVIPEVSLNANEGRPIHMANLEDLDLTHVTKVQFAADIPIIDRFHARVAEEFPGVLRGHPYILELPPDGITKWEGIETALDRRGLAAESGLGVGDSGNDTPWLPKMGISLAAPDSPQDLIDVVDAVLPSVDHPVATLITTILRRTR
nr:HAD family hydrolase [Flaviflexus huanghaiensis]